MKQQQLQRRRRLLWVCALSCAFAATAAAQNGRPLPANIGSGSSGGGSGSSTQRQTQPDTFGVYRFRVDNPNEEMVVADTTLEGVQQYDPTRRQVFDYRHLGILGSAHQPIVYEPWLRRGFTPGLRQYELYQVDGRSMPYYRLQRPYTSLSYVQGSEQADGHLTAQFSRNFAAGLNFCVDYRRINQIGEADQYPNQQNRTTALALGLGRRSLNGRYDAFLSFSANTTEHKDNGGVRIPPIDAEDFATPGSAQVFLADARTRYARREWMYTQYYRLGGGADSLGNTRRAYTLSHQFVFSDADYKFRDEYALVDSFFYDQWYNQLLTDDRGARYFISHRLVENSFRISTFKLADTPANARARNQRDLLEVGLTHRYNAVNQEPADTIVNNLLLTGRLGLRPGERLRLEAEGQLDLWDQAGDYRLTGALAIDMKQAGALTLKANSQLYQATLLQQRHWITQQPVWDNNNFQRTLETNLGVLYALPRLRMEVGGHYHLINNYIYFDTTGRPAQTTAPVSLFQLTLRKDFRFGPFTLGNTVAWQQSTSDALRVPALFGKHSLYYSGRWFKNMEVQTGIDLRYATGYHADHYNPLTGQFNLQNRSELDFFPNADLYFSMKVRTFRFFIKWENATTLVRPDDLLYLTAFYPFPDAAIRMGIRWRLLD